MLKKKINFLDPLVVEKNEQIFYIKNIHTGNIVFDVGANIGELTLLFSKFVGNDGQVHSFEPTPTTFEKLDSIIKIANKKNVILNKLALDKDKGHVAFNIYDEEYASWNTLATRPLRNYGIHINLPSTIVVPTTSIDLYCSENSIKQIDLLKIDVEGAELNVLTGSEKMFKQKKIKICVFEFGQTIFDMGNAIEEFRAFFRKHDYKIHNISKRQNLFPIDGNSKLACFSVLAAIPN